MADKTPIRVVFDADNVATGLGEFQSGETIPLSNGGTGSALTIGGVGQVLRVNSAGNGLEFADQGDIDVIASTDSTGVQVQDDLNISGVLSANQIDTNIITSQDSAGILINDALIIAGPLKADGSTAIQIEDSVNVTGLITSSGNIITGDGITAAGTITSAATVATGSITAGTSFIIGNADINETDLEKLDSITNGTAAANKAVVADGNIDVTSLRNVTASGILTSSSLVTETISSADSTSVLFNDGITVGGPIRADASTGIQVEDSINVLGKITQSETPVTGDDVTTVSFVEENFSKSGFPLSTQSEFPLSDDSTATDFQDNDAAVGDTAATDAFGVGVQTVYDCMEPIGSITATDLALTESHVGA